MSLDVYLVVTQPTTVFTANVTHDLNKMAEAAGIYQHLWRPDYAGIKARVDAYDVEFQAWKANLDKMFAK